MPEIRLAQGAEEAALALMLEELMQQNLKDKPQLEKDFNALNIGAGIVAEDADVQLTLDFRKGTLTIHNGLVGNPKIVIRTDSNSLLELTALKIKFGLPYFFDENGLAVTKKFLKRELRIKGLTHLIALIHITRILSVS